VWMDQRAAVVGRRYLLKHTSHTVPAFLSSVDSRTDLATLARVPAQTLEMNDIGAVSINLLRPIAIDRYTENRATGAFILIDPESNATVAAGMIREADAQLSTGEEDEAGAWGPVTAGEREARWGHRGGVLELTGPARVINAIERALFAVGVFTSRIHADEDPYLLDPGLVPLVANIQTGSGLLVLLVRTNPSETLTARVDSHHIELDATEPMHAVTAIHQLLHRAGIFIASERAGL